MHFKISMSIIYYIKNNTIIKVEQIFLNKQIGYTPSYMPNWRRGCNLQRLQIPIKNMKQFGYIDSCINRWKRRTTRKCLYSKLLLDIAHHHELHQEGQHPLKKARRAEKDQVYERIPWNSKLNVSRRSLSYHPGHFAYSNCQLLEHLVGGLSCVSISGCLQSSLLWIILHDGPLQCSCCSPHTDLEASFPCQIQASEAWQVQLKEKATRCRPCLAKPTCISCRDCYYA